MSDTAEKKPRKPGKRRPKKNFATLPNAVHITVYDPQGSPVPSDVLSEAALSVYDVAKKHNLVIATATG